MNVDKAVKTALAIALCGALTYNGNPVSAQEEIASISSNEVAKVVKKPAVDKIATPEKKKTITKKVTKKITPYQFPGEISVIIPGDIFIDLGKTVTVRDLLVISDIDIAYSITGMEGNYYYERASVPSELDILVNDRITIEQSQLDLIKNGSVGMHMIKGTYYNELLKDTPDRGIQEIEFPVNVVNTDDTEYNKDPNNSSLVAINARNYEVKISDAKALDLATAKVIQEAQFKAWCVANSSFNDLNLGQITSGEDLSHVVKVNEKQLDIINNATHGDAYQLDYFAKFYDGITTTKTTHVFVTDKNSVLDRAQDAALFANDFTIDRDDVSALDNVAVLTKADAKAYTFKKATKLDPSKITFDTTKLVADAQAMVPTDVPGAATSTVAVRFDDGAGRVLTTNLKVNITSKALTPTKPIKPTDKKPADPINNKGSKLPTAGDSALIMSSLAGLIAILSVTTVARLKRRNYNL